MRTVAWSTLTGLILLTAGCDSNSALAGKWLGSVTEKGKATKVALDLRIQGQTITGTFTILQSEGDVATGASFTLVNARRSDGSVEFIVPISGQIDADAVFFELLLKRGRLEGYGREMRQGSQDLPAVLVKQK